jgi:catechol-2,3-dioxygenase
VHSLGHVVEVRDLQRSETFYADVMGMLIVSRTSAPVRMRFFPFGVDHHDFAITEISADAPMPDTTATGLAHVACQSATHSTDSTPSSPNSEP